MNLHIKMSANQLQKFVQFIEVKDTLTQAQRDACIYIFTNTSSIISQVARRSSSNNNRLSLATISSMVYQLMTFTHRFVKFSGEDKKEIVTFTILAGFHAHGLEIPAADQDLIEQTIDLIWWASHSVAFAVKKQCTKLCGKTVSKHDAVDPLHLDDLQPEITSLKRQIMPVRQSTEF